MKHVKSLISIILSLTIAVSMIIFCIPSASAATVFTENDVVYSIVSNFEAHVYGYKGTDTVVEIPEKVGARVITAVDSTAFFQNETVEEIILPDTVLSIGDMAFMFCTNLKTVKIPVYLNSIGDFAFLGCSSLSDIDINSNISSISISMFEQSGISSIKIPYNVSEIKNQAFRNCKNLTSVVIPDSVKTISKSAFENCTSLESAVIMQSVTSIDSSAFANCPNLIIYGYEDSYAQQYANENNIPFVIIPEYEIGDIDLNGRVDVNDATEIQRYSAELVSLTDEQILLADMNADGLINISDATAIQKYIIMN